MAFLDYGTYFDVKTFHEWIPNHVIKQEYSVELREGVNAVLDKHGGIWSKHALSKTDRLDSAMRESQHLNMPPAPIGVLRRVVAQAGVLAQAGSLVRQRSS